MLKQEYGAAYAQHVLIQPVDEHDLAGMEKEIAAIRQITDVPFRMIAVSVDRWNRDLSPWSAPPVFGREPFGNGASLLLEQILRLCTDAEKTYYLGGYSLAGLFALWAAYQTDVFTGVASASGSLWFPGFDTYMAEHEIRSSCVYLSLGDREEKVKNPLMASVGDRTRQAYALLRDRGVSCTLEWNPGNHFTEPDLRTAKAFAWLLNHRI
jgi:predicted alpha/beta superfamily hydrolase